MHSGYCLLSIIQYIPLHTFILIVFCFSYLHFPRRALTLAPACDGPRFQMQTLPEEVDLGRSSLQYAYTSVRVVFNALGDILLG